MPAPFKRLSIPEFALLLERFPFSRRITSVHMHHTWRPNHAQFRGHDSIVAMWRFHTQERHFSDIAQHLTIDPDGFVWTGRNWNAPPASASGFNGNSGSGPFMFETVGDFDRGMDALEGPQRAAVLDVIRLVQARFGLPADALMFHNQMARKSCPGTGVDRTAFLREVAEHPVSVAPGGQRDVAAGPFAASALASSEAVERAIELLKAGDARAVDGDDAELDYGDEMRSATVCEPASRGAEETLGADAIELLRPHVINLRMGRFSADGAMTTTSGDVDALFDTHLKHWVEARPADAPARILFFAHGGLVSEKTGLAGANRTRAWWLRNGVYPVYFVWETGFFQTIGDLLQKVKGRVVPEGARDVFDWTTDPVVEEAARALQAVRVWGAMKASAALASATGGGAHYVAERLHDFMGTHGERVELHAVGHSAGSIFHGHFLPVCRAAGVAFRSLQLLAPAITCDDFKRYLQAMSANGAAPPATTMFTMNRTVERADNCANVYRKSLLYLVSEACEHERKTPILGLEDSLRADAALRDFFGLRAPSATGSVVWSKSPADTGRSATRSTSHGGFDDDAPTMGSVLRRIRGLQDADPIEPFPTSPGGREAARSWSEEVDWPEVFDHAWVLPTPAQIPWPLVPQPPQVPQAPQAPPVQAPAAVFAETPPQPGRRVAVCFGINDYPTAPLNGCVSDAARWLETLKRLGFDAKPIRQEDATRAGMLRELNALIANSRAGDSLVFQYSGHGTQVEDLDGDEAQGDTPGLDEAICPIDFADGNFLIDDDIAEQVALLPAGVQLSFLLDCCHSGTGTRFAARTVSAPPAGSVVKARYIVPSPDLQALYRQVRGAEQRRALSGGALGRAARAVKMREVTFAACRSKEVAWEVDGQGEFTRRAHDVLASGIKDLTNVGFLEAVLQAFGANARQQPQLDCEISLRNARWLGV
jgi:hypothetical protein